VSDYVSVAWTTAALYATVFVLERLAGRRTVSQLSTFDALVTIAVGSVLASAILARPPSYGRGAVAVVMLLALQIAVGALRQRSERLQRILDFSPQVVFDRGEPQLDRNPLGAQLTPGALEQAMRAHGVTDERIVARIVLEPDGQLSILREPLDPDP
jgi:uncharacterized membrane protein YcaP (DUF421 family)